MAGLVKSTIGQDKDLKLTGQKQWRYIVSPGTTAEDAIGLAPVSIGSTYSGAYPGLRCINLSAENENDGYSVLVTAEYGPIESEDQNNQNDDDPNNPLNEPVQESYSSTRVEVVADKDANGKPYVNKAGVPFVEIPVKEQQRPTITLTKNLRHNGTNYLSLIGCCNSSSFRGRDKHTLKLLDATSSSEYDQRYGRYYKVSITIEYNPDTYKTKIANVGYAELVEDDEGNKKLKDLKCPDPRPLDNDGKAKEPGEEVDYITFQPFETCPFDNLLREFI